ncbi:unnamed protein product [Porites lobata]|uniref:Uncharacterized protein n=1 Tax=Porites lobata TaxID=104759 RepID=A0ABN8MR66_9CNID|nr:unnamed protein product [Porites lobata]
MKNLRRITWHTVEYSHTPPLEDGSPYCPVALGFLHLARRGAFLKDPIEAWESQDFSMRERVGDWRLFCQTDTWTQTLKSPQLNGLQMGIMVHNSVQDAGFDARELSHSSYRSLRRLGGWSVASGVVHLYVKKIIEQYSDSAGLITPVIMRGVRQAEKREEYLRNIPSAYNFRLQAPLKNITTQEEAEEMYADEFRLFVDNYEPLKKARGTQQGAKYNNKAHATRHQRFLSEKNDEPHDARKQEPPAPPKEVNVSKLKGQVIHSWTFLTFTPPYDNNNKCASTPKNGKDFYGYAFKTLLSTS